MYEGGTHTENPRRYTVMAVTPRSEYEIARILGRLTGRGSPLNWVVSLLARWGSFAIGMWLVLAPLVLGYASPAPVLHDVALGLVVCFGAIAALQWPLARFALALPAAWLYLAAPLVTGGEPLARSTELAAAVALFAFALVPGPAVLHRPARMAA